MPEIIDTKSVQSIAQLSRRLVAPIAILFTICILLSDGCSTVRSQPVSPDTNLGHSVTSSPANAATARSMVPVQNRNSEVESRRKVLAASLASTLTAHPLVASTSNPFISQSAPERRDIYIDTSDSDLGNLVASWMSVEEDAFAFLLHSAPDSSLEVYATGVVEGHPILIFTQSALRQNPVDRRASAESAVDALESVAQSLQSRPPHPRGSFLEEDLRRLSDRINYLGVPASLIVYSDFGQWSSNLNDTKILSVIRASLKGTQNGVRSLSDAQRNSILSELALPLAPLPHPPDAVYLIYLSPRSGQGPSQGFEEEMLTWFFQNLLESWGTARDHVHIEEPDAVCVQGGESRQ